MMMYNDNVERLFFSEVHAGFEDGGRGHLLHYSSPSPVLRVSFMLECRDKKWHVRYKARANPYIMAACAWICEQVEQYQSQWEVPSVMEVGTIFGIPALQQVTALQIVDICQLVHEALKSKK